MPFNMSERATRRPGRALRAINYRSGGACIEHMIVLPLQMGTRNILSLVNIRHLSYDERSAGTHLIIVATGASASVLGSSVSLVCPSITLLQSSSSTADSRRFRRSMSSELI